MERRLTWVDVFTSTPLAGNGLAVVHDADDIDDATMLAFARETNLSETTFVQSASEDGADYRNRIWMPDGELDFAGHPSLGTAVAVVRARGGARASYVQQTRAGLQPVDVELDDRRAIASMLQNPATFGPLVEAETALAAVGLELADADDAFATQVVSTGQPHLMVPVREMTCLQRAEPRAYALRDLLRGLGCTVLYLAAIDLAAGTASARSFFSEQGRVLEDPATGSAAGPLLAHLHAATGATSLTIDQGIEMGRPGRLDCEMAGDRVRVSGEAVIVAEGTVWL